MIEANIQQEQERQDKVSSQLSHSEIEAEMESGFTMICGICEAVYAASPLQLPFLRNRQEALEAAYMSLCHFCFRCRRAACPQCWDGVHGVCGACVLEAHLPFRVAATPLEGLVFTPTSQCSAALQAKQEQSPSLFSLVRSGRFSVEAPGRAVQNELNVNTDPTPTVQPIVQQTLKKATPVAEREQSDTPTSIAIPTKTSLSEVPENRSGQKKKQRAAKVKRAGRLERVFTWIVLVIVLLLVGLIALAEYIPAINALVLRAAHIDIHAEIAYLVRIIQQLFKK